MVDILQGVVAVVVLLLIITIWGYGIGKRCAIELPHLPMQILVGFFGVFIFLELLVLPILFFYNNVRFATGFIGIFMGIITLGILLKYKLAVFETVKDVKEKGLFFLTLLLGAIMVFLAVGQRYLGFDTTYYVGMMNSFLTYNEFWTRDACMGLEYLPIVPLHYALSCFYPFFAMIALVFHIPVRIVAMFVIRGLCVFLFGMTAFCCGYEFFGREKKYAYCFTLLCFGISVFMVSEVHGFAFMMMVRGYESKGYCAAVVAPMCILALIKIMKEIDNQKNWHLLAIICWASMPVAMSSMAVIPVAVAVAGFVMMIYYKRFFYVLLRCFYCVLPNLLLMSWYIIGKKFPMSWGG